jgi:hypothetical protein
MTSNLYDNFRSVQGVKKECYDKRSAAFINTGKLSQDITHTRLDEEIKAAIVFNYKEGPDDTYIFTYIEDDLLKGDYFAYDSGNYLVYEDVKLTDSDIDYKKQKAAECNVTFEHDDITYIGYFTSSVRSVNENEFIGSQAILPDETPLLIVPTGILTIGDRFTIEGKPFKIQEYDNITNKGIMYLYLERDFIAKDENEVVEEVPNYVIEETPLVQDTAQDDTLDLRPMTEYTFTTELGYFTATPKVEVLSRSLTEIKFRVPFGIEQVIISIKKTIDTTVIVVPITYTVVL